MQRQTIENLAQSNKCKTLSAVSHKKFENIQKLTSIVDEIKSRRDSQRSNMPERVLDTLKNKIKANYNALYENYDQNKPQIMKKIQQVQKNQDTQAVMNNQVDNLIKQKQQYDKLKNTVAKKKLQLKKLQDLKQTLDKQSIENKQLVDMLNDRYNLIALLDEHRISQDYQTAIYGNMKHQRNKIKLTLKNRYDHLLKDQNSKNQRILKLQDNNHTKKLLLQRIEQQLTQQQHYQMPLNLAEQLQKKIGEYQGKFSYENIIEQQNRIQAIKKEQQKRTQRQQRQKYKQQKLDRERQQKRQYQIIQNHCLFKQSQQEKIKKLCNVQNLEDITKNPLDFDFENLEEIRKQVQADIQQQKQQKIKLQEQIQQLLSTAAQQEKSQIVQKSKDNLLKIQQQIQNQQTQLRRLHIFSSKRNQLLQQWLGNLQFIVDDCNKQNVAQKLKSLIPKLDKLKIREKLGKPQPQRKFIKVQGEQHFQSQQSQVPSHPEQF